ncbi:hypothetical protein FRB90_010980 [Tulasnella sp. 427]|nr:hypothetical protein FRB90_010980 [Tulasnella sp. 427]
MADKLPIIHVEHPTAPNTQVIANEEAGQSRYRASQVRRRGSSIELDHRIDKALSSTQDGTLSPSRPTASEEASIVQPGAPAYALPDPLKGIVTKIKRIGGGAYGNVYQGVWTLPGKEPIPVAIKCIREAHLDSENDPKARRDRFERRIRRETVIWQSANHQNILPFYGYQIVETEPMLVSPWCNHGSLSSYISENPSLTDVNKIKLIKDAACGLAYLHSLQPPIIHGDIKPDNVIITDDIVASLCDFGISRVMTSLGTHTGLTTSGQGAGTAGFQAKELFDEDSSPTEKSDVYAFGGLILAKTMSGKPPFYRKTTAAAIILAIHGNKTATPADHPGLPEGDSLWNLLHTTWHSVPANRPSMAQVLVPRDLQKAMKLLQLSLLFLLSPLVIGGPLEDAYLSNSHQNTVRVLGHPDFAGYQIRLKSPRLCDTTVKQYSGYTDITEGDKNLFFWFFESRQNPAKAPLIISLGGGPACSSSTRPLSGVGPCTVTSDGQDVVYNKVAWNDYANVLYLDQLVNVGFSYSSVNVTDSTTSAEDVYAFLQIFFKAFPQYAEPSFHVHSHGYGGVHGPIIASTINQKNKELRQNSQLSSRIKRINLSTVMIGNGFTELRTQSTAIAINACQGPYPIYSNPDGPECRNLTAIAAQCQKGVQDCYDAGSTSVCGSSLNWCVNNLFPIPDLLGINSYDLRIKCSDPSQCVSKEALGGTWLNKTAVKVALGADPSFVYSACNGPLAQAMTDVGEAAKNTALLLPELLADGIRLLNFAGDADYFTGPLGASQWMSKLDNIFKDSFKAARTLPWSAFKNGTASGMARAAGGKSSSAGNYTWASIYRAGHFAQIDQPEVSYYMFKTWLDNKAFV